MNILTSNVQRQQLIFLPPAVEDGDFPTVYQYTCASDSHFVISSVNLGDIAFVAMPDDVEGELAVIDEVNTPRCPQHGCVFTDKLAITLN
jgi:hypothetical protein